MAESDQYIILSNYGVEMCAEVSELLEKDEKGLISTIEKQFKEKSIQLHSCDRFETVGINSLHYIGKALDVYHIKTPTLYPLLLGWSRLNEIFIYKLLDLLGYGPNYDYIIDLLFPGLILNVTKDLNTSKKLFILSKQFNQGIYIDCQQYEQHICALEFLIKFLSLKDLMQNHSNSGLRLNLETNPKISQDNIITFFSKWPQEHMLDINAFTLKGKPMIIDFHLQGYDTAQKEDIASKIIENLKKKTDNDTSLSKFKKSGNSHHFESGFRRIIEGKNCVHRHLPFLAALEEAYDYTVAAGQNVLELKTQAERQIISLRNINKQEKEEDIQDPLQSSNVKIKKKVNKTELKNMRQQIEEQTKIINKVDTSALNLEHFYKLNRIYNDRWNYLLQELSKNCPQLFKILYSNIIMGTSA